MRSLFRFGRRDETPEPRSSRAKAGAAEPAPAEVSSPAAPAGDAHRSLALPVLLAGLQHRSRLEVLDLGPALPANIDFLSGLRCRLTIEDLPAGIGGAAPTRPRRIADLLSSPPEHGFDAVFAWDLLDYLESEELAGLASRLGEICATGAYLFALVAYRADMPERPHRFRFVDQQTLLYQPLSGRTRPAPRRNARDLGKLLSAFTVEGTYLLRNGYHEYLFVRR